jgi:ubiquinone/menaquinone biosynthesis C-methylase UbiE
MNIKKIFYPINLSSILHLIILIYKDKSPIRIFHNYFLKTIKIKGKTIDLGAGMHSSYFNYLKKKNTKIFFADKYSSNKKNTYNVDLEKKLKFKNNEFNTVVLFNVLEHIRNYKGLINEINRITKKKGKVEIFVPFMHRYHPDPHDIFRPTHFYLHNLLTESGFKVTTNLIGVGPLSVFSEIILKYLKFKLLKIIFFILFLILDRVIRVFSKDYNTYYNGIHCTCIKY